MTRKLARFDKQALDSLRLNEEGAPDLVRQLTEDLFVTTPARLESIKSCINAHDWERAALEAHALKSSIRTMGGMLAGDLCLKIESSIDMRAEGAGEQAAELCDQLAVEYALFAEELASFTGVKLTGKAAQSLAFTLSDRGSKK